MSRLVASTRAAAAQVRRALLQPAAAQSQRSLWLAARAAPSSRSATVSRLQSAAKPMQRVAVRHLNLHEYQSKALMAKYNVRVQKGMVASTPEEAERIAVQLLKEGAKELVVKAQVHAGGRGKGHFTNGFKGGVKISTESAHTHAQSKERTHAAPLRYFFIPCLTHFPSFFSICIVFCCCLTYPLPSLHFASYLFVQPRRHPRVRVEDDRLESDHRADRTRGTALQAGRSTLRTCTAAPAAAPCSNAAIVQRIACMCTWNCASPPAFR